MAVSDQVPQGTIIDNLRNHIVTQRNNSLNTGIASTTTTSPSADKELGEEPEIQILQFSFVLAELHVELRQTKVSKRRTVILPLVMVSQFADCKQLFNKSQVNFSDMELNANVNEFDTTINAHLKALTIYDSESSGSKEKRSNTSGRPLLFAQYEEQNVFTVNFVNTPATSEKYDFGEYQAG